ncbi:hypothetical protein CK203_101601 [Vitis vinifera]|uniref:Uncharacterized protein n=1 Tax=Vitis vinifera TaxID=29760 RepID=A0A438CI86_VITVI|nr:hypothetical protein CK203_101601 [Vitis vinifera]
MDAFVALRIKVENHWWGLEQQEVVVLAQQRGGLIIRTMAEGLEPETPISTSKGILSTSTSNSSFSKEELRKAEELMTKAFVEFHKKLRGLNVVAHDASAIEEYPYSEEQGLCFHMHSMFGAGVDLEPIA